MALAVPNPRSVTDAGMRTIRDFAQERGLPVSIHLLETGTDEQMCRQHTGFGAVDHLDRRVARERLRAGGIPTTVRDTRGSDIDGACGQLAASTA